MFLNKKEIKPPAICVGCGYCCKQSVCLVGIRFFISKTGLDLIDLKNGCPALVWTGKRYSCELTLVSGEEGEDLRKDLGINTKCCSPNENWRNDVKEREKINVK